MSEKTAKSYHIHGIILIAAILLGAGAYFGFANKAHSPENEIATAAGEETIAPVTSEQASTPTEEVALDIQDLLRERIIGDVKAPIKISEHASFTCGHCAHFHKETFQKLKEDYIDKGKAYMIFSDFPLNAPALHATVTARCVPEVRYFDFVHMLFTRQEEWAYNVNYLTFLKDRAVEYGISQARFDACMKSEELQKGILEHMRQVQTKFGVESTPSFVVNDGKKFTGALPYDQFVKAVEEAAGHKPAETPAAETPAKTE